MGVLENLNNVIYISTYYKFKLFADPDDNKYVDCAVASGADYIVSEDKDYKILEKIDFPKVNLISIQRLKKS